MAWWIAGAVVLVSLLGLAAVAAVLRRRLAELDRVARLAQQRATAAQRLPAAVTGMQATLAGVNQRSAALQRRLAALKRQRSG